MSGVNLRRKHGANGLSKLQLKWINPPRGRPWARLFVDVLDGAAWRGLSVNARRVLDALICHHFRYYQKENGNIHISHRQFQNAGVTRRLTTSAIRELEAARLISTKQGEPADDVMRPPTLYHLNMYDEAEGFFKTASRRFVWAPVEVMESPEWCGLSINARQVMDRLLIENVRHKSEANGKLRISSRQFVRHGIGMRLISGAIKELMEAGFLAVTLGKSHGSQRAPHLYRITFLGTLDGPATWQTPVESNVVALPGIRLGPTNRKAKSVPSEKLFPTSRR